jgi:hypothetical protein
VLQIDFRRTDVTAKARITYFKGRFLEVKNFGRIFANRASK